MKMKKLIIACIYSSSLFYMPATLAAEPTPVKGLSESNVSTSTGPSVKDSADQSASKNSSGQVMSLLSAGMLAVQSYNYKLQCPKVTSSCVMAAITAAMAVMSMMQSKEHGSAASASGLTSGMTDGGKDPYATGNSYDPATSKDPDVRAAANAFDKLKNTGMINQTKGTITTPDGKEYKIADFASEKAMTAAGIPSGAAKGAMNNIDKITAKAAEKAEKIVGKAATSSEDSFGGGGGSTTIVAVDDESAGGGLDQGRGLGSKRDPAQLAGMQKNYNGEPIGVAADSIFLMMNRRYQVKQSQDSFFGEMDLRLQK